MRNYVLIRDYNPAYRYWIRAHLKQKRIVGDREYSWKEAQQISMDMAARGVKDEFFKRYFGGWGNHPEHPPDYFDLLCMTLPIYKDEKLDFAAIAQLDSEARKRDQRILFTAEDAAKDFYDFYDKFLSKPLAQDLERGAEGRKLITYFEYEELAGIPDIRVHGEERAEEGRQAIAAELLERLRAITPEKILLDIKRTLERHYDKGFAAATPDGSYNYSSEFVRLSTHRLRNSGERVTTFLKPARSYGVLKEGYEGVYYPTYYVELALQESMKSHG